MTSPAFPRITAAQAISAHELRVCFENGVECVYDCSWLFALPQFFLLRTWAFFRAVRVDSGGWGLSWNDDLDLAAEEVWLKGIPTSD